jgi:predicted adenylyl cyclase CyaB
MRDVEIKAVVYDWDARRDRVVEAGAELSFAGRLEDRRYDTPARDLSARGEVLRMRVYRSDGGERAEIGWKGPTSQESGYKVREELGASTPDAPAMALILRQLGFLVTQAIDREIVQYDLNGTTIRFERYPRMDDLVEVEGSPAGIERAVAVLGIPRSEFTAERLPRFVRRFEERTGRRAAICDADLQRSDRRALHERDEDA